MKQQFRNGGRSVRDCLGFSGNTWLHCSAKCACVCVSIYGWPRRKSPETLARHVGMVFGNPKLSSVALMFVRDIDVRKKSCDILIVKGWTENSGLVAEWCDWTHSPGWAVSDMVPQCCLCLSPCYQDLELLYLEQAKAMDGDQAGDHLTHRRPRGMIGCIWRCWKDCLISLQSYSVFKRSHKAWEVTNNGMKANILHPSAKGQCREP